MNISMNISEGLKSYEIVLLVMGVLLFLVLVFLLIYFVINKRTYKGLLPFFIIPLAMVGFPSIQKITFDNGMMGIEKLTKEVEQDPTNAEAKKELEVKLKTIENRPISQPSNLRILEKAYTAAGDSQKVNIYRERLLPVKPIRKDNIKP